MRPVLPCGRLRTGGAGADSFGLGVKVALGPLSETVACRCQRTPRHPKFNQLVLLSDQNHPHHEVSLLPFNALHRRRQIRG